MSYLQRGFRVRRDPRPTNTPSGAFPMANAQRNVERATFGLITALFLAAALFLLVAAYYLYLDFRERQAEQEARTEQPVPSGRAPMEETVPRAIWDAAGLHVHPPPSA